jgi:threonine/homoserine/homoserine lactone efflux protein
MPQTTQLVAFAVTAFVLILIPGPSVLFTVGRALSVGRRSALLTVLGNTGGLYVQVITVALGVGAIVEASVGIYTVLKLAGGAYLVYLGCRPSDIVVHVRRRWQLPPCSHGTAGCS